MPHLDETPETRSKKWNASHYICTCGLWVMVPSPSETIKKIGSRPRFRVGQCDTPILLSRSQEGLIFQIGHMN